MINYEYVFVLPIIIIIRQGNQAHNIHTPITTCNTSSANTFSLVLFVYVTRKK